MIPTGLYDVAQTVLDCVCSAMDDLTGQEDIPAGYACPCLTYVSAGEPSLDCCTNDCSPGGMLTVHLESVYPSDNFPFPSEGFAPCKAAAWVAVLVVTASRCAPTVDEQGNTASPEALSASARLMAIDQYAVLTALSCCLVAEPVPGKRKRRVKISESQPLVSEGGCAAIEIRALVEVGQVCACPEPVS